MNHRVLIINSENATRSSLKENIEKEGVFVEIAPNLKEGLSVFSTKWKEFVMIVTDLRILSQEGRVFMSKIRQLNSQVGFTIMTDAGVKEDVLRSLQYGVCSFFEKPFKMEEFNIILKKCIKECDFKLEQEWRLKKMHARLLRLEGRVEDAFKHVSNSQSMTAVNETLIHLRRNSIEGDQEEPNVMIFGESGTGKQGVARMIHLGSSRAQGPWISLNCAIPKEQIQRELFGSELGGLADGSNDHIGVIELAGEGTLFLENIHQLDISVQNLLELALSQRVYRRIGGNSDLKMNARIISTATGSQKNFNTMIQVEKFREDLYRMVGSIQFELPALCERLEEIPDIALAFAREAFSYYGKTFSGFGSDVANFLKSYAWPGNLHELHCVIERLALCWSGHGEVHSKDFALPSATENFESISTSSRLSLVPPISGLVGESFSQNAASYTELKKQWCDSFEKKYLIEALNRNGGNVSAAAREAKLDRSNFLRLLRRHGLKATEYRNTERNAA